MAMQMRNRAPAYRGPVLHFDALRLLALREGDRIEVCFATENEKYMPIRAPAHVHSAHAAFCCWGESFILPPACSANWLDGPLFGVLLYVFGEYFLT